MHPPLFNSCPLGGHLLELYLEAIFSERPPSVGKTKTNHYYGLLSIARSGLLARLALTQIKRDTLGLQWERRRYEPLPNRGRARGKWHALTYAEIMLSVVKGFGFPLPHQRVWEQGDDYRSQICISNYQDPFAKGPMCAKSNSSCEALVIVCINLHAEPWTPKLYCGKTVGASESSSKLLKAS